MKSASEDTFPRFSSISTDDPALARARELVDRVINGAGQPPSMPSLIADRIEQKIITAPETCGAMTEHLVAREFRVGRRAARQVSRILQLRGVMEPRRGGNGLGGLRIARPSYSDLSGVLGSEANLIASPCAVLDARRCLLPAITDTNDALHAFVGAVLNLSVPAPGMTSDVARGARSTSQSNWLADRMLGEIETQPTDNVYLGSVAHLSERYGVSLDVVVEAVRILVDAQRVNVRRGRSGGIYSCVPHGGRALHVANAYFAAHEVSAEDCRRLLDQINIGMIELARQKRDAAGLERAERSFHDMLHAPDPTSLGKIWYGFIRDIAEMCGNPVLHFMARALAASILMRRTREAELPAAAARELLAASQQILDHLRYRCDIPVERAQARCQQALENYW